MKSSQGTGLVDRVYREILKSIIDGEFAEGEKLPAELTLTERYTASRPTIREALTRLRADGITSTRQGSGTYVQRRPDPDLPRFTPLETLSDVQRCFEFRFVIESGAAALAATTAGDAEIAEILQRFQQLNAVIAQQGLGSTEDFDFHMAVARATRNQFFISAIGSMQEQIMASMTLMRGLSLTKSAERQVVVQAEHEVVLEAIRRHDPQAASQGMRQHLENARDRMFGK